MIKEAVAVSSKVHLVYEYDGCQVSSDLDVPIIPLQVQS